MNPKLLVKNNIFVIPYTEKGEGLNIVYLPLHRQAVIATVNDIDDLCDGLKGKSEVSPTARQIISILQQERLKIYETPRSIDGLLNMMILPNSRCNFKCSYCYSAQGRNGKEIDPNTLRAALDYFLGKNRASDQRLTISILGGGEPMLSWHLLKPALDYAYRLAEKRGMALPVSLVTNGSIVTDDLIDYCLSHDISVSVSFDILEDVQNSQRGHYSEVVDNINRLTDAGIDVAFNTVITNDNVDRMTEMIRHMNDVTPKVKKVSFKSLISGDYFSTVERRREYYCHSIDNFFEARKVAADLGIYLTSPYLNSVICVADRYCPGKFVVGAEGTVSICHCVSSKNDKLYQSHTFASFDADGRLIVDKEKFAEIQNHDQNFYPRCAECEARWHCAGGCYTDNCTMSADEHDAYCDSMRYFLKKYILTYLLK